MLYPEVSARFLVWIYGELTMNNGREYKEYSATPEDATAMVQGFGYTVRYGKQNLGYYATQREAIIEAGRKDGAVFRIKRLPAEKSGSASLVVLIPLDEVESIDSTAESIAKSIKEQIGAHDGPISPLAKQRVVILLYTICKDKRISKDAFDVLYPAASDEQFDRLWDNLIEKSDKDPSVSKREQWLEYAESRGLETVVSNILNNDINGCYVSCEKTGITLKQFNDLLDRAVNLSVINHDIAEKLKDSLSVHIARVSAEKSLGGDIMSMLLNDPGLMNMAKLGDGPGIVDYLHSSGNSKKEAEEISGEIISLSKLLRTLK